MRLVGSANTKPELIVRRIVHGLGYRYRLHRKDLPGTPDLAFISRKKVVFVHGCFWHGHDCGRGSRIPKTNTEYWQNKVARNKKRDARAKAELEAVGWEVLILWECELKDIERVTNVLQRFLS
jgi:DNA mismatch endonuclease (patch repair protein)